MRLGIAVVVATAVFVAAGAFLLRDIPREQMGAALLRTPDLDGVRWFLPLAFAGSVGLIYLLLSALWPRRPEPRGFPVVRR